MPINGGTRMLRARRKDINVKPNRRLDRKSSRGMLFENEELRMRTITINAEVEQGQHALKKLRRENEQLRREMWSLRDEYDKMEKLLRKKETDEDTDQENSDTDDNYSQSVDSDEEKEIRDDNADETESNFGNVTTTRAFDGLSVIDEQTEETTTQTTECGGNLSRGNSANRTLTQPRQFDDPSCEYAFYDTSYSKMAPRKKVFPMYETDSTYVTYGTDWPDNGYEVRPASPYPYPESIQPSYQRRFQVLQNLPPMIPDSRVDENGWMFPGKTFDVLATESVTSPISIQIPRETDYSVVRTGPDVFISDVCAKKQEPAGADDSVIKPVENEIDKNASEQESNKTKDPAVKSSTTTTLDESVPCQNPCQQDVQQNEDMAKASKFQSKLVVTLKTPKPATLKRVPPVQVPPRLYNTVKPECQGKRYECRYAACRNDVPVLTGKSEGVAVDAANIPLQDGIGLLTEAEATQHAPPLKPIKIPPAPPPRTTSCLGATIPDAIHHRTFRGSESRPDMQQPIFPASFTDETYPMHNPLMLSEPMATSSPRIFQRLHNRSLDNLSMHRKQTGMTTNDESSTEDVSLRKTRTTARRHPDGPHLNKSVSSPSFGTFLRRKPSEHSVSSMENGKMTRGNTQNNASVSSSSGLDSPTKSDRRKRRVSIKFNKKILPDEADDRGSEGKTRGRVKSRHDETDVTTSERERTNSVSSRASSGMAGSGRRKLSISSNRTYVNDEKIPWCGCWGNGCV